MDSGRFKFEGNRGIEGEDGRGIRMDGDLLGLARRPHVLPL